MSAAYQILYLYNNKYIIINRENKLVSSIISNPVNIKDNDDNIENIFVYINNSCIFALLKVIKIMVKLLNLKLWL